MGVHRAYRALYDTYDTLLRSHKQVKFVCFLMVRDERARTIRTSVLERLIVLVEPPPLHALPPLLPPPVSEPPQVLAQDPVAKPIHPILKRSAKKLELRSNTSDASNAVKRVKIVKAFMNLDCASNTTVHACRTLSIHCIDDLSCLTRAIMPCTSNNVEVSERVSE